MEEFGRSLSSSTIRMSETAKTKERPASTTSSVRFQGGSNQSTSQHSRQTHAGALRRSMSIATVPLGGQAPQVANTKANSASGVGAIVSPRSLRRQHERLQPASQQGSSRQAPSGGRSSASNGAAVRQRRREEVPDTSSFKNLRTSIANRISASLPSNSTFVQQMTQFIASPDTLGPPSSRIVRMPEIQMPKWEADEAVTLCNLCRNTFTFSRRKHHCRLCGKIYCQNCSNNQVRISRFYNYPQRICNGCFETIRDRSLQQRQEQFRFTEEYPEVNCNLNRIPDAVIIRILRFVPERNLLLEVALVSRHFHYLTNSNDLWKALFFNHWAPQLVRSELEEDESDVEGLVVNLGRAVSGDNDVHERYLRGSRKEGSRPGTIIRSPSLEEDEAGPLSRTRVVYLDDDDFEEGHWKSLFKTNIELDRRVQSTINYLPPSALAHMLRQLSKMGAKELLIARQVCSRWRDIIDSRQLFLFSCSSAFGCMWQPEGSISAVELGRHAVMVAAAADWYGVGYFSALLPCTGKKATAQTTAMHSEVRKLAVGNSSPARLKALLQHSGRAAANATDTSNGPVLHLAVRMQVHVAVELLLAAGANVDARTGGSGRTALQVALDNSKGREDSIVELLITAKADVSVQDYYLGETALHNAVLRSPSLLPVLLRSGEAANFALSQKNNAGLCPTLYACSIGALTALKTLLHHSDTAVDTTSADGRSTLMLAASHGTPEMLQLLLDSSSRPEELLADAWRGQTAADLARVHCKPSNVRLLEEAQGGRCCLM